MLPIDNRWIHVAFEEQARYTETYGFVGSQGTINLEGVLSRPAGDTGADDKHRSIAILRVHRHLPRVEC